MAEATTAQLRAQCIQGYGGCCVICGDADPDLLQFDHVRGGGRQERKTSRGRRFYLQLIRQQFPDTIQLLCVSCHAKKPRATGGDAIRPTPIMHPDIASPPVAEVTPHDERPASRDCQGIEALLRGVTERLDRVELELRGVTDLGHGALPAVRTLPADVAFESPTLEEAWRLQDLARRTARADWLQAQKDLVNSWWERLYLAGFAVLVVGGGVLVCWLARWLMY